MLDTFDDQVDGPFGQVEPETLRRILAPLLPPGGLLTTTEGMRPYETDGLAAYRSLPGAVALPETVPQVQAVLKACSELGVPVVARGAGTGLSGGALTGRSLPLRPASPWVQTLGVQMPAFDGSVPARLRSH